jgi:hypothetical protein
MNRRVLASLVRKELRLLAPLVLAMAGVLLCTLCFALFLEVVDEERWVDKSPLFDADARIGVVVVALIMGIAAAYNLFPGEHETRTIDFMRALPVRRATVFGVKLATGAAVLVVFVAVMSATTLAYLANPSSLAHGRGSARLILLDFALTAGVHLIALAHGALLSFFRRLGWLLLVAAMLLLQLAERISPELRFLSPLALFDVEHHGAEPIVPWRSWAWHLAFATAVALAAARLWSSDGQGRISALVARVRVGPRLRRLGLAAAMLALALGLGGLVGGAMDEEEEEDDPASGARQARAGTAVLQTKHFHFTYRPAAEANARFLAGEAEMAYARVRDWLGAPAIDTIVADLTDESPEHAGIAGWKKIRMDIRPPKSRPFLRHVLYHETTHVFSAALAAGWSDARHEAERAFLEGLAEHVAFDLLGMEKERQEARALAAAAHARFRIRFEDLLDPAAFLAHHDEELLYVLGEVWVAAIVDACGRQAPGQVLAAWGRPTGPQALTGVALWQQTLQERGCDHERAIGRFHARLADAASAGAALPIASARLVSAGRESLTFELAVRAPQPGTYPVVLALRDGPDTAANQIPAHEAEVSTGKPTRLTVPRPRILGGDRFELQVGARPGPAARAFRSRWHATTLPR